MINSTLRNAPKVFFFPAKCFKKVFFAQQSCFCFCFLSTPRPNTPGVGVHSAEAGRLGRGPFPKQVDVWLALQQGTHNENTAKWRLTGTYDLCIVITLLQIRDADKHCRVHTIIKKAAGTCQSYFQFPLITVGLTCITIRSHPYGKATHF